MSPEPPLDATGIARRQFSTARKGYDQGEVRAFLHELSDLVGRLHRGEAHEHDRALRAEERAHLAEQLDEHRLVELLGEETARVLDAARAAASDIRTKAEESAARLVREAQAEAHSITAKADKAAAARRVELLAEADQLRHEAEDEVERRRLEGQVVVDNMRREAEEERERLLQDGERARGEAEAAAEQIRASAREQGRRLVGEAQAVRERMLSDLARRRRTAREQLERLNGARERLLAAYQVVKRTVDEATTELTVALPEAKLASELAMRRVTDEPEESVEMLEAELSVARMSGLTAGADAEVTDDELDAMLREMAEQEAAAAAALGEEPLDEDDEDEDVLGGGSSEAADSGSGAGDQRAIVEPGPGSEPDPDGGAGIADPVAGAASAREMTDGEKWGIRLPRQRRTAPAGTPPVAPAPPADRTAPVGATDRTAAVPGSPGDADRSAPGPGSAGGTVSTPTPAGAPTLPLTGTESVQAAEDEGETGPYVDELFARIRGERTVGAGPGAAGDEATTTGPEAAPASDSTGTDDSDVEAEGEAAVDPATRALRHRDETLATVERELGRKLKRVLADEQNEVLDTLRRGGTVEFDQVVPAADEHADRFAIAATAHLDAAALHGAAMAGSEKAASCDELAGRLGITLVEPLRARIERSFDDCDGDLEEVAERLRSLYREWKVQRIGAAVRHYTSAAFAAGTFGAVREGEPLRWVVDESCDACPDCDDNALAGDVAKGDAFPTGDACSPAHSDCRCLVMPAAMLDPP